MNDHKYGPYPKLGRGLPTPVVDEALVKQAAAAMLAAVAPAMREAGYDEGYEDARRLYRESEVDALRAERLRIKQRIEALGRTRIEWTGPELLLLADVLRVVGEEQP